MKSERILPERALSPLVAPSQIGTSGTSDPSTQKVAQERSPPHPTVRTKADKHMLRRLVNMAKNKSPPVKLEKLRTESGFKAKKQDIHSASAQEDDIEYVVSGAMRKVVPYYFTYLTYCKLRWRDRTLVDIFTSEFRDRSEDYYTKTIAAGEVLINGQPAGLDTLVRNGDLIQHRIHRHEPAVTSRPIRIVEETDELVIIDKPAGIPVHPTGRYRYNTVSKVMKLEMGMGEVHPCNRLDRLTSGLMFLAKTPQGAEKFVDQLKAREVKKEYIARVKGVFPDGLITVEKPLTTLDPRLGLNVVDEEGKEAKTEFLKISSDGETSIVKCMPHTGRTHQIRVHLQWLGHPIANDPIYSNGWVWGPELGKEGSKTDMEQVKARLHDMGKSVSASSWFHPDSKGEVMLHKQCEECGTELYSDPGPNDLDLWLHAYRYYSTGEKEWSHQTSFPEWALEPHKKYMELALKEAQKCGPTTTAFSVGALLVKDGEILSAGYSRELPGNTHAEQCALEKYYEKHEKLPEATVIYTTMEPCSLRLSGNEPCVDRILKTDIRACFVGVVEPDTFVKKNVGLEKLKAKGVEYIKIDGLENEILEAAFKGHPKEEVKST